MRRSAVAPFIVGLVGAALAGLALRDALGLAAGLFITGMIAGLVGRRTIGIVGTIGGILAAWAGLLFLDLSGVAQTMWSTAEASGDEVQTLWLIAAVLLAVTLVIAIVGYLVGMGAAGVLRRLAGSSGSPTR